MAMGIAVLTMAASTLTVEVSVVVVGIAVVTMAASTLTVEVNVVVVGIALVVLTVQGVMRRLLLALL
jgi:hypothetical protein